jgi:hypothetical protein
LRLIDILSKRQKRRCDVKLSSSVFALTAASIVTLFAWGATARSGPIQVAPAASAAPCATPGADLPKGELRFSRVVPVKLKESARAYDVDVIFSLPGLATVYLKGFGTFPARGVLSAIVREPRIDVYNRQGGAILGTIDIAAEHCGLEASLATARGLELEHVRLALGLDQLTATPSPTPRSTAFASVDVVFSSASSTPEPSPAASTSAVYSRVLEAEHAESQHDYLMAATLYSQVDAREFAPAARLKAFNLYLAAGDVEGARRVASSSGSPFRSPTGGVAIGVLQQRLAELNAIIARPGAMDGAQIKQCIAANSDGFEFSTFARDDEIDPTAPVPHVFHGQMELFDQDILPTNFLLLFHHKPMGGEQKNNLDVYRSTYLQFELPGRVKGRVAVRLSHWTVAHDTPAYDIDYAIGEQTLTDPTWRMATLEKVLGRAALLKNCIEGAFGSV